MKSTRGVAALPSHREAPCPDERERLVQRETELREAADRAAFVQRALHCELPYFTEPTGAR